jgi:hypothetical protein
LLFSCGFAVAKDYTSTVVGHYSDCLHTALARDNFAIAVDDDALVVTPDSGGFRVLYNSARSDGRWQIGLGSSALAQGYLIVRNYLIKYQPSANPRPDAFFKAGASDADCVYIRLVAPGDTLSRFALRRVQGSSDIITLKMKSDAACFAS